MIVTEVVVNTSVNSESDYSGDGKKVMEVVMTVDGQYSTILNSY